MAGPLPSRAWKFIKFRASSGTLGKWQAFANDEDSLVAIPTKSIRVERMSEVSPSIIEKQERKWRNWQTHQT
jgi:hypothetical protein